MVTTQKSGLYSFEENERVTAEIESILAEDASDFVKTVRLQKLKSAVTAPISKNHVDYYLNKMAKTKRRHTQNYICITITVVSVIFNLCRMYWYDNPDKNPFASAPYISLTDFVSYLYLIPVVLIVYFLVRRFRAKKR